jgi:hypothetical protein
MERFLSNNLNDKMYSGSVKITTMDNFTSNNDTLAVRNMSCYTSEKLNL